MRARSALTAFLLLGIAAIGCSSGNDPNQPRPAPGLVVTVGDDFFRSTVNGTQDPAIDTVAVGDTVSWVWNSVLLTHSVRSLAPNPGDPTFPSSAQKTGLGEVHTVVFGAPGSYEYDCGVHGQIMTGRVVVQ